MNTSVQFLRLSNGITAAGAAKRLYDKLAERGIALWMVEEGALVASPKSRLTDLERAHIREYWADLALIVRAAAATPTERRVEADEHSYGVSDYSGTSAWWVR